MDYLNSQLLRSNQRPFLVAGTVIIGITPVLIYGTSCYRSWYALGAGGPPHNLLGWLVQSALHVIARRDHRRVPPPYAVATSSESFISGAVPARPGPRPAVPTTVAPQRQVTEQGSAEMRRGMDAFVAAVAAANPGIFALKPSRLESPAYQALWLAPGRENSCAAAAPRYLRRAKGEFVHVHPEGSTHVTLSLDDAAMVVERGWGERHKLSGVSGLMWFGYLLLYAPRDEGEFAVWREIVLGSARFVAAGSPEIVKVPES